MPWTKTNYPNSMKNLPDNVRNKAIEIGNALLEEKDMDEGIAIASAISRAKDWAANRGQPTEPAEPNRRTDIKQHGEDRIVSPHRDKGWEVKKEAGGKPKTYDTKEKAVRAAKEEVRAANASVTIQRKDGKIEDRISYNPHNKAPDQ